MSLWPLFEQKLQLVSCEVGKLLVPRPRLKKRPDHLQPHPDHSRGVEPKLRRSMPNSAMRAKCGGGPGTERRGGETQVLHGQEVHNALQCLFGSSSSGIFPNLSWSCCSWTRLMGAGHLEVLPHVGNLTSQPPALRLCLKKSIASMKAQDLSASEKSKHLRTRPNGSID